MTEQPAEVEQTPRRFAEMAQLGRVLEETGATLPAGAFAGPCSGCDEDCSTVREEHIAVLVEMGRGGLCGWTQCPNCRGCASTWGSKTPPQRCTWGTNLRDEWGRIGNDKCLNEAAADLYVTEDNEPRVRVTVHLCQGHLHWAQQHMPLRPVDPSSMN